VQHQRQWDPDVWTRVGALGHGDDHANAQALLRSDVASVELPIVRRAIARLSIVDHAVGNETVAMMPNPRTLVVCSVMASFATLLSASQARANGAFPAPFKVFAPASRPNEMVVTTNFGLIDSYDAGKTWSWTCEHGAGDFGYLYQQAPGTSRRILAVAPAGVVYTDDRACTWSTAGGFAAGSTVTDSFVDPSDGARVFALASRTDAGTKAYGLFVSSNGGTTFDSKALYTAPANTTLDGVEVALSNPRRLYLTSSPASVGAGGGPSVIRSDDGGATFTSVDVSASTGVGTLRIVAIHPTNPDTVYFRFSGNSDDRLMISTDKGATLKTIFTAPAGLSLSAFHRRPSGTLFVAAMDAISGTLFRSTDGGATFDPLPHLLHVGSIVERDGVLYVLGDGVSDPFVVGLSRDEGTTFEPFLNYSDIKGVKSCPQSLLTTCHPNCENVLNAALFEPKICETEVGGGGVGGSVGGVGGSSGRDAGNSGPKGSTGAGCGGCTFGSSQSGDNALSALLISAAAGAFGLRRKRAGR